MTKAFTLQSFNDYVSARQMLIEARTGFFTALRQHLRPEQRIEAAELEGAPWNAPARIITDEAWRANPVRGYLSVLPDQGRAFRMSVLQMGTILRVGIRVPRAIALTKATALERIRNTYPNQLPNRITLSTSEEFMDWQFDVPDLYYSVLTMETAIHLVGALFEQALQATMNLTEVHQ